MLLLLALSWLAAFSFTLWRLRAEALDNGAITARMHARNFEESFTQTLQFIELMADSIDPLNEKRSDYSELDQRLSVTLRPTPFLRSLSILDARGRIVASSSKDNLGYLVNVANFFPIGFPDSEVMRIGVPQRGRDFSQAIAATETMPVASSEDSFIPLVRRFSSGGGYTLAAALNPDYFVNHGRQLLDPADGRIQWLRYDDVLLATTAADETPGVRGAAGAVSERLSNFEQGSLVQKLGDEHTVLTAYRASRRFPVVVAVHIDRDHVLASWKIEARRLAGIVLPIILALSFAGIMIWRRQQRIVSQQHELERERSLAASLFDTSSESIIMATPAGNILAVNPAFERITGYAKDEVIGKNPRFLNSGLNPAQIYEEMWTTIGKGELWQGELKNRKKNGEHYWAAVSISPVIDGQGSISHYIALVPDITERKQVQDALLVSEARLAAFSRDFEAFLNQTTDFIYFKDADSRIRFCSQTMAVITGYDSWQELVGKHDRDIFPPDTARIYEEEEAPVLAQGKPLLNKIDPYYNSQGKTGYVQTNKWPLFDAEGKVAGIFGISRDITERIEVEKQLVKYRDYLEELLKERSVALDSAREARAIAEAASRAKSSFLANMSHELRTPMNAIMGMTNIALRRTEDAKLRDPLLKIDQASRNLLAIINDILDISKIEAEHLSLEQTNFLLGSVFENLASLLSQKASEKGIELRLDLPSALSRQPLVGDPVRLGQILLNIVGNAVKFTEQGNVTVSARPLEDLSDNLYLRFDVTDTGIGISSEAQERLFTAFEQADNSTTRKYGGTGLGLAISKRLVHMMGGEIGVDSTLGQGSNFWVTVRLIKNAAAVRPVISSEQGEAEAQIRREYCGVRVLLAEDEPINREVTSYLLEDIGLSVDLAEDGLQALALAQQNRYALILMDMQMPNLNGIEAARAIRTDSLNRFTPIMAMTANAFDEDRQVCLEAGMNDHLAKPVDPDRLFESLLKWLSRLTV